MKDLTIEETAKFPKDDLISREEVLSGMIKYGFIAPDMTAHEFVEDELHSVSAVPLDKLCEWLADYMFSNDCAKDDMLETPDFWREEITKWMEEQDVR